MPKIKKSKNKIKLCKYCNRVLKDNKKTFCSVSCKSKYTYYYIFTEEQRQNLHSLGGKSCTKKRKETGQYQDEKYREMKSQATKRYYEEHPESRELVSKQKKKDWSNIEYKEKMRPICSKGGKIGGKKLIKKLIKHNRTEAGRKKLSIAAQKFWDEHPEAKKELSEYMIKYYQEHPEAVKKLADRVIDPEVREKISETVKNLFKDPEYRKKFEAGRKKSGEKISLLLQDKQKAREWVDRSLFEGLRNISLPTNIERILIPILENYGFKYVGNRAFWIGDNQKRVNPDFVNESNKTVIEAFGNYWHDEIDEIDKILFYEKFGWDCIVFWEDTILSSDIEKSVERNLEIIRGEDFAKNF